MMTLPARPGAKTLEVFASNPAELSDLIHDWWNAAVDASRRIQDDETPNLPKGFYREGASLCYWSDSRGIDSLPIFELLNQLCAYVSQTRCFCGGVVRRNKCSTCGSTETRVHSWEPPEVIQRTLERAGFVIERWKTLVIAKAGIQWTDDEPGRRKKRCYDLALNRGNTWEQIQSILNAEFSGLSSLDSADGKAAKAMAKRYAEDQKIDAPPKRQAGRPKK